MDVGRKPYNNWLKIMNRLQILSDFLRSIEEGRDLYGLLSVIETLRPSLDVADLKYEYAEFEYPGFDYSEEYVRIGKKYPFLGYYRVIENITEIEGDPVVGIADACDDLTDIVLEIRKVLWCGSEIDENAALCELKFAYDQHIQHHLIHLKMYLTSVNRNICNKAFHSDKPFGFAGELSRYT